MKKETSWGNVAEWYDEFLEASVDSYQKNVILPNILRILNIAKGDRILDFACGQGFFSRAFAGRGARVTGVDVSPELIALARKHGPTSILYYVAHADAVNEMARASFDAAVIILAIQNIKNMEGVFTECSRLLTRNGRFIVVINHPAFRIPKRSSWGWDGMNKTQYRRIDGYLTESKVSIDMHPGTDRKEITVSFHRPLQTYVNMLAKCGFGITRMEEWISHRVSMKGPRQQAENRSRKEIPLFMMMEAQKLGNGN